MKQWAQFVSCLYLIWHIQYFFGVVIDYILQGNAGKGTNGANGGAGGQITIRVNDDESYYLIAFRCLDNDDAIQKAVQGGDAGKAGQHGRPGQGTNKVN